MDMREKIYTLIQEKVQVDYDERTELAKELVDADRDLLVQDLERFYIGWFDAQEEKEYTEERWRKEKIQEVCFEVACEALALSEDPSVIPYFLKYLRTDDLNNWRKGLPEVSMEDYNTQHLIDCIMNYYGLDYIPVLLAHIHELVPEKSSQAKNFIYHMIEDTFYSITSEDFPDALPVVDALPLGNREVLLQLLTQDVAEWQELLEKRKLEAQDPKLEGNKLEQALKRVESYKESLYCTEYVLGQLLSLPEK